MNEQTSLSVRVATLGPIGYLTMPGTVASIVATPLVCFVHACLPVWLYVGFVAVATCLALGIIGTALESFKGKHDPAEIVLDEVIGCFVVFCFVPLTWFTVPFGLALFRFFDITKWFGVARAERLVGAYGVLVDDILAAILANLTLRLGLHVGGFL